MILEEFSLGWSAIYWNHPEDEFVIEMDRPVLILNSIRSERDNPFSLRWYKTKLPQGDPAQTLLKPLGGFYHVLYRIRCLKKRAFGL